MTDVAKCFPISVHFIIHIIVIWSFLVSDETAIAFTVPIETLVMKVVGCRVTAIAGALLTIIGMVSAAFCTQIWQLVIAYSFVAD